MMLGKARADTEMPLAVRSQLISCRDCADQDKHFRTSMSGEACQDEHIRSELMLLIGSRTKIEHFLQNSTVNCLLRQGTPLPSRQKNKKICIEAEQRHNCHAVRF